MIILYQQEDLQKQKNFSYLIDEFKMSLNNDHKKNLLIFGEGEEKEKLEKKINEYNS